MEGVRKIERGKGPWHEKGISVGEGEEYCSTILEERGRNKEKNFLVCPIGLGDEPRRPSPKNLRTEYYQRGVRTEESD